MKIMAIPGSPMDWAAPIRSMTVCRPISTLNGAMVPATMRTGAGMWDCAGASDKYHIWACGSFAVHMPIFGAPGMGALVRVKVPGLP